ncbi:MAG: hypothetical protein J6V44_12670 [Methanobrevibacter sp.]|nr:hypothetical protein [Methanobrevibacter sp.]
MKDLYNLKGHDGGLNAKFVKDHDDIYNIEVEYNYRVGYKTDPKVDPEFVDPSGGPFISVGYKTANVEVVELFYDEGYKVKLKLV